MTKSKPVPEPEQEADAPDAQPLSEGNEPEPVTYRRSPMEDPTHPLHHLRDA
jgi:hypothetical protein